MELFLTLGTKVSGALRLYDARNRGFTAHAWFSTAVVNIEIHLKIPSVAIAVDKIFECAAAAFNGRL